jgi:2-amino-4-hydroxy-6-hydroxymethyldihydropteridine diphosphokinase
MTGAASPTAAAARVTAGLGLGGNLGDPAAAIAAALGLLAADGAVTVTARSRLYRTAPWGDPDQPPFLNACALVETALAPRALLDRCLAVERALGRARDKTRRWGPRLIDVDLLFHGDAVVDEPGLTLPHPRLFERAFVLEPLAEIAPDRLVAGRRIAEAAAALGAEGVTPLDG